jgi:OPA family glycerol-3-phosphate transporter-like MFS transporter
MPDPLPPQSERRADTLTEPQKRTLGVIWSTYGSFYFCRVNIGAAAPGIRSELGIDPLQMGLVQGALKIGYAVGQFINGQLTERLGAKRILLVGMLGSVAACLLFALGPWLIGLSWVAEPVTQVLRFWSDRPVSQVTALLCLLWLVNGYCQACGWPSCVKIMANWFSPFQRGRVMGVIGTSYQVGTALTLFGTGYLIVACGNEWRAAFILPAGLFLLSALHTAARLTERPAADPFEGAEAREPSAAGPNGPPVSRPHLPLSQTLWITLTNSRIWVLAAGLFGLDVVRFGFLDWAPSHLKEVQGTLIDAAALKAAVLPLGGALGALVSGWLSDRFFQSRRAPVITGMLIMVALLTLTYGQVARLGWRPTVACLGAIGFFLYGAQILLVGTAAQDYARHHTTAAAAGFVDFMGYLGAFSGDVVTGWLLKHRDWHAAIYFWAGTALAAALIVATLWQARAENSETSP